MSRAYALARSAAITLRPAQIDPIDITRSMIVLGCALALVMAGQPLSL